MKGLFNLNEEEISFATQDELLWIFDTPRGVFVASVRADPAEGDDVDSTLASGERIWYVPAKDDGRDINQISRQSNERAYVQGLFSAAVHHTKNNEITEP